MKVSHFSLCQLSNCTDSSSLAGWWKLSSIWTAVCDCQATDRACTHAQTHGGLLKYPELSSAPTQMHTHTSGAVRRIKHWHLQACTHCLCGKQWRKRQREMDREGMCMCLCFCTQCACVFAMYAGWSEQIRLGEMPRLILISTSTGASLHTCEHLSAQSGWFIFCWFLINYNACGFVEVIAHGE